MQSVRKGLTLILGWALNACEARPPPPPPPEPFQPKLHAHAPGFPAHELSILSESLRRGDNLSSAMDRVGLGAAAVDELVRALTGTVDVRTLHPGQSFELVKGADGSLAWMRLALGPGQVYHVVRESSGELAVSAEPAFFEAHPTLVRGRIEDSLYSAMDEAGESPLLTMLFVELFAWDIDFFTETQEGDQFQVIVEKREVDGLPIGYGTVLAAEYRMALTGKVHRALWYVGRSGQGGYYTPEGTATKKEFLKSPVKFSSITSRFGMRRHPVLQYVRAHQGVDYAAPTGTAIWAMGDGVIDFAGRRGGYGNVVILRHSNGFESRYAHLSAFGRGVRRGVRVMQKQIIGYVGMTGLATGPHLHFEVLKKGRHINPLQVSVPPAPPIDPSELPDFRAEIAPLLASLDRGELMIATATTATVAAELVGTSSAHP